MRCNKIHKVSKWLLLLLFWQFIPVKGWGQEALGDARKGLELFNMQCAACHDLQGRRVGPPLGGLTEKRSPDWVHKFIKNSSALIASDDPDAVAIFEEYNNVPMISYEGILTDEEIYDIIAYMATPEQAQVGQERASTAFQGGTTTETATSSFPWVETTATVASLLFILTLFLLIKARKKAKISSFWQRLYIYKYALVATLGVLTLLLLYFLFVYLMQIGVDSQYQPFQPIHFSHKIHSGDHQIDCKYCHSGVRSSSLAGIPSTDVCMGCHRTIQEYSSEAQAPYTKDFYNEQLQKLYMATGWDKEQARYSGEPLPIEWVRIHALPDHVYFNHAQHVTVGGISCEQCHGAVKEMEVVRQEEPLTMGWCISCHRTHNIDDSQPYYEKIHKELAEKYGKERLTVSDLGGEECAKCHY